MNHPKSMSIYLYMDYREFLRDWFDAAKRKNARFSLRAFAKRAGFRSHNSLKLVMQGERNVTALSIRKFTKGLALGRREAEYFKTLVHHNQALDPHERQALYIELLQFQEMSHIKTLLDDQQAYYSRWYHTAIRELIAHPGCRGDPAWIADRLLPRISRGEAEESIGLLERIGLIRKAPGGGFEQTDKFLTTGSEAASRAVAQYHRQILDLSKSAIERIPRGGRDISCLTLGMSEELLPVLKRRIQLFQEEVMRLISTCRETGTVVQFNFQLFPLMRGEGKEPRGHRSTGGRHA